MNIATWKKQLAEPSGNLTTNASMPAWIVDKLLTEVKGETRGILFEECHFPKHKEPELSGIVGLDILAGLQNRTKQDHLTLFRAIRFPTDKRMWDIHKEGFVVSNYEQERILELYRDRDYLRKRTNFQADERFWVQPQERVVDGVPLFALANDAIQIHRAFRGQDDRVALVVLHIPREHLESGKIQLTANTAIDLDYKNADRDIPVRDFREKDGVFEIDYAAMRARGVDLHEMYTKDLPRTRRGAEELGIKQEYLLLHLYEIQDMKSVNALEANTALLKMHRQFLHGFFGDQNIFARRQTKHLPYKCFRIKQSEQTPA